MDSWNSRIVASLNGRCMDQRSSQGWCMVCGCVCNRWSTDQWCSISQWSQILSRWDGNRWSEEEDDLFIRKKVRDQFFYMLSHKENLRQNSSFDLLCCCERNFVTDDGPNWDIAFICKNDEENMLWITHTTPTIDLQPETTCTSRDCCSKKCMPRLRVVSSWMCFSIHQKSFRWRNVSNIALVRLLEQLSPSKSPSHSSIWSSPHFLKDWC